MLLQNVPKGWWAGRAAHHLDRAPSRARLGVLARRSRKLTAWANSRGFWGSRSFVAVVLIASAVGFYAARGAGSMDAMATGQIGDAGIAEDVAAVKQLGSTMGDAMVKLDMGTLDRIYADDWASVLQNGHVMTKQEVIKSIRSGDHMLLWYELGRLVFRCWAILLSLMGP